MAFNRDRNSRSGGGFRSGGRPRFEGRGDRGPVEMHKAICDNCRNECEVPFKPTSGKPVFCKNCFQNQKESPSERPMFEAVCDECGNSCRVPFRPSGDKPIYCSNCFGEKRGAGNKTSLLPNNKENGQFEALNQKLDKILQLLTPRPDVEATATKEEAKPAKKRAPKKSK